MDVFGNDIRQVLSRGGRSPAIPFTRILGNFCFAPCLHFPLFDAPGSNEHERKSLVLAPSPTIYQYSCTTTEVYSMIYRYQNIISAPMTLAVAVVRSEVINRISHVSSLILTVIFVGLLCIFISSNHEFFPCPIDESNSIFLGSHELGCSVCDARLYFLGRVCTFPGISSVLLHTRPSYYDRRPYVTVPYIDSLASSDLASA